MPGPSNDNLHKALLPQGLRDLLPPAAEAEAEAVGKLIAVLSSHGYERVKPPLMEFEENLLSGAGAAMAPETFRLMDPISQRMIALRADMTTQVARIAGTRLANTARLADRYLTDRNWPVAEHLGDFAEQRGHTLLELAFSWLLAQAPVSSVIAGATRPEQLEQNVKAGGWVLTAEDLAEVDRITAG